METIKKTPAKKTAAKTIPMKQPQEQQQPQPVNEDKQYAWQPEDEFIFNGTEFSILYNGLLPVARIFSPLMQVFQTLQDKFEAEVASGKIVEK